MNRVLFGKRKETLKNGVFLCGTRRHGVKVRRRLYDQRCWVSLNSQDVAEKKEALKDDSKPKHPVWTEAPKLNSDKNEKQSVGSGAHTGWQSAIGAGSGSHVATGVGSHAGSGSQTGSGEQSSNRSNMLKSSSQELSKEPNNPPVKNPKVI